MATNIYIGLPPPEIQVWIDENVELIEPAQPDGSLENPFLVSSIDELEKLRKEVAEGDCKEGIVFKQSQDFDMTGYEWEGIGLKNGDDPDPEHTFKGIYDGGGHAIKNLQFKYVDSGDDGANELMGFIRSAMGAEIKNLKIHSTGFKDPKPGAKFGGAILVGTAKDGIKISNCSVSGNMGSEESPCGHTASGILSYITLPSNNKPAKECPVELKNVTNYADIYSTRKAGGVIGFALGHVSLENVTNNGNVARVGDDNGKTDAVGGVVAYGHGDAAAYAVTYDWNNVTNTGTVTSNMSGRAEGNYVGQIVGKWAHQTHPSKNSGFVKIKSDETPLSKYCPTNGSGTAAKLLTHLPVYFGEKRDDGYVYGVSELENGKSYLYMVCNYGEGAANNPITGPAFTLADGASITVDCKFGTPNIIKTDGTSVVGELIDGTIYSYTA
jgi:hypothetical protein